ncbi:MAG: hypothetical protein KJO43_02545, partial [Phycisphaerae bacterium]|nr:hypothetical protein [Phycisphaerae bacterium]
GMNITLFTAAGVLFYNATGKYIPAVGVLTIGLVHAAHMFIPNHQLSFTLPVWLVMTHATVIATFVHGLEDKRPRFDRRGLVGLGIGWGFWSAALLGAGVLSAGSLWPEEAALGGIVYPLLAVAGFAGVARWKTRVVSGRVAAEKLKRYGAMWQSLYGAAWLLALGLRTEALWIGLLAVVGFGAMTLIKEVSGLSGRPLEFRV